MATGGTPAVPVVDEGRGSPGCLVSLAGLGDGRAPAADASRGPRAAGAAGGRHRMAACDTHLRADFPSGARRPAAGDGPQVLAPAAEDRAGAAGERLEPAR